MNGTTQPMPEITATELKHRLDKGDDIQIVDVREDNEVAIAKLPNSIHDSAGAGFEPHVGDRSGARDRMCIARWVVAVRAL